MILGSCRYWAFGTVLAAMAAPAIATTPASEQTKPLASADGQRTLAGPSRRVELPFPLDVRASEPQRTTAPRDRSVSHPFRESELKRAALDSVTIGINPVRLSQPAEFG